MPLQRVFPKRGFDVNRVEYVPINLTRLQAIVDKHGLDAVTPEILADHNIIKRWSDRVKILAFGTLTSKVTVKVHATSEKAKAAIEGAGGSVELV